MVTKGLNALREVTKLSVDITELLRDPGSSRRLEFREEVSDLALEIGRAEPRLDFELTLESLVEGILVSGEVRGSYVMSCIRCLREFAEGFALELREVFAYPGLPGTDEGYEIVGDRVDLEPAVRDAVLLAMPVNPLHAPDCAGLCAVCGADRNTTDCGHARGERVDLRWEPLERLKERMAGSGGSSAERPHRTTKE